MQISRIGVAATVALVVALGLGAVFGVNPKILVIGGVAFAAMASGALLGSRTAPLDSNEHARNLVWGYGVSSGAMVTSASVFLVPPALSHDTAVGGFGVASGVVAGFVSHAVGHATSHSDFEFDYTVVSLTAHSVAAGVIIGVVYASMPSLGLLLGLAIVSHKAPAGYAAARRLASKGSSPTALLLPSAGVGVLAVSSNLLELPDTPAVNAAVFGFAAGIFLHIAMDFLPRCELGSHVYEVASTSDDAHAFLDRLRVHAVVSTSLGFAAVLVAWLLV